MEMFFDFSDALRKLKNGERIQREGWSGKGMWVRRVEFSYNPSAEFQRLPYLELKTADDQLVPWVASHTDMEASDWQIV